MPYYEYECAECGHEDLIVKSIREYDRTEKCPNCSNNMQRLISKGFFVGEKVQEAYFHHGLGQVVKGDYHARKVAKQKGLIEVGNEKAAMDKIQPKASNYEI